MPRIASARLLADTGTAQTKLDYDAEVDFGLQQIALTHDKGPLTGDVERLKLEGALADVKKTTEALARGLGRSAGGKRRPPSKLMRDAVTECAAAFNAVHDELSWFVARTPKGADRDSLEALLAPIEALLSRNASAASTPSAPAPSAPEPSAPEPPLAPPEARPA